MPRVLFVVAVACVAVGAALVTPPGATAQSMGVTLLVEAALLVILYAGRGIE